MANLYEVSKEGTKRTPSWGQFGRVRSRYTDRILFGAFDADCPSMLYVLR